MKTLTLYITVFCTLFGSCTGPDSKDKPTAQTSAPQLFPERAAAMNIYEVNIRQYTPEGTFQAFIPHLDRLEKMGVSILWIMPIQPIGVKNRKGRLGSPYSIQDYTAINPEFGTTDDFKALIAAAHEKDMLVILDWVANHTAWDHHWMTDNPDFHTRDTSGNAIPPVPDWSDVADLNYDNEDMQSKMINEMKYWVAEHDLDGFRCDVAGEVPMTFWNKAKAELNKEKDLFMLAEWDEPVLHDTAFHMTYGWAFHHVMNEVAKGNQDADSVHSFLASDLKRYGPKAFRMNFTSNHDENSWNGTVYERMGDGALALAVLAATAQGMPLIYSGQEAGLAKRLSFFDKDSIDWSDLKLEDFYTKLLSLKKSNKALWNGAYGGGLTRMSNHSKVYAYRRTISNNQVICIINLSGDSQELTLNDESIKGIYQEYFTSEKYTLNTTNTLTLAPWQYLVFSNN